MQPLTEKYIEEVIREVVARLNGQTTAEPGASHRAKTDRPREQSKASSQNGTRGADKQHQAVEVSSRVVTLASLDGKLNGAGRLVVRRGAVVTPAVRDLLKEQSIELAYAVKPAAAETSSLPVVVGVAETAYDPSEVERAIAKGGRQVQRLANSGLVTVVDEMVDQIAKAGCMGLLFTGESAAALCLANRQRGVRATMAADLQSLSAAVRSIGPNLIVIDPVGRSTYAIRQMVAEFLGAGTPECPEMYREKLS